ncbi:hypothetical protein PPERSA_12128 [Pseudocohnilembus persalinus]|uniref:Oxysterol-binding protein n=1 Tax=Pseudocohnilembus persalinus TaxID=266149 RepID=A0A0V0QNJ3_PSEPJ|nr:hypothetical protein PPERSA_12128 [Pseudocohnilembus persalinus]|eukprot:KRX03923.1 hypothetical protein PPERSA_12128 [Pseudocohnilembus persalinus]
MITKTSLQIQRLKIQVKISINRNSINIDNEPVFQETTFVKKQDKNQNYNENNNNIGNKELDKTKHTNNVLQVNEEGLNCDGQENKNDHYYQLLSPGDLENEEKWKIISERYQQETRKMPYFNVFTKTQQFPIYKTTQEQKQIEKIIENTPSALKQTVLKNIQNFLENKGQDLLAQTSFKYEFIKDEQNIYIFQSKAKPSFFRGIMVCKNQNLQDLVEEMLIPSFKQPHWNPMIKQFEVYPTESTEVDGEIIKQVVQFKRYVCQNQLDDQNNQVEKTLFYHRHSYEFQGAHFIICKTFKEDHTEDTIKNNFNQSIHLMKSPYDTENILIIIDLEFDLENERDSNDENQSIDSNYIQELKNKNRELKLQNNNNNNENNSCQINSYRNDQFVKIKDIYNLVSSDSGFSQEQLIDILEIVKHNQHIMRAIKNYTPMIRINVPGQLLQHSQEKGHFAWGKNYDYNKKGGISYKNEKLIKEQKSVAYTLLKRIGSSLMHGKSLMNISMPVTIFDKYSMLQRNCSSMGYAPVFLKKAAETKDPVEQLKWSACFSLAQFILGCDQTKPFNPIIGETFQARVNGYPTYFEQTTHHPPVCNYIHYGPGYKIYGANYPEVHTKANSLEGYQRAHPTVQYENNGKKIYMFYNNFIIYNLLIGQRYMNCIGRVYTLDPETRLVAEVIYNPNDKGTISNLFSKSKVKIDEIGGAIYKVKQEIVDKLLEQHKVNSKLNTVINPQTDIEEYVSKIEGIWHSKLIFDGEVYWDTNRDFPYPIEFEENPLPSDSNYREDMTYFQLNNLNKAQEIKESMEQKQREDSKLRKKWKEQNKKKGYNFAFQESYIQQNSQV